MHSVANDCTPTYLARSLEVDSSVPMYLFNNVIKDSGSLEFSTHLQPLTFILVVLVGVVSPDFNHGGF